MYAAGARKAEDHMTGIREDKKSEGRRKNKPFPFGMRELLTLAAACETAALGWAIQLRG